MRQNLGAGRRNSPATSVLPSASGLLRTSRTDRSSSVLTFLRMICWPASTFNDKRNKAPWALTTEVKVSSKTCCLLGPRARTWIGRRKKTRRLRRRLGTGSTIRAQAAQSTESVQNGDRDKNGDKTGTAEMQRPGPCAKLFTVNFPEWRNWQTQQTQNLPGITPRVGSTPSSGTNLQTVCRVERGSRALTGETVCAPWCVQRCELQEMQDVPMARDAPPGDFNSMCELESGFGSRCRLSAHLLHELSHGSHMTRAAAFGPGLKTLGCLFQMSKDLLVGKTLAERRNDGLNRFPNSKKLTAGLKEEVLVQEPVIEQRAGLLPITDHHAYMGSGLTSHRGDTHGVIDVIHDIVFREPIARLA